MGESLSTWTPSCNGSVRVELSGQRTTSDSGALLLREALDNSGVIEALEDNLVDRRHPLRIRHSLASQLRTLVLQRAMGWIDLSDTDTLRRDPLWQLACSDARGMTPLVQDRPSQATLSRLLGRPQLIPKSYKEAGKFQRFGITQQLFALKKPILISDATSQYLQTAQSAPS